MAFENSYAGGKKSKSRADFLANRFKARLNYIGNFYKVAERDSYSELPPPIFATVFILSSFSKVTEYLAREPNSVQLFELCDENVDDFLRIINTYCKNKGKSPIIWASPFQTTNNANQILLLDFSLRSNFNEFFRFLSQRP